MPSFQPFTTWLLITEHGSIMIWMQVFLTEFALYPLDNQKWRFYVGKFQRRKIGRFYQTNKIREEPSKLNINCQLIRIIRIFTFGWGPFKYYLCKFQSFWTPSPFTYVLLKVYSCMSLYMWWPLTNFYTFSLFFPWNRHAHSSPGGKWWFLPGQHSCPGRNYHFPPVDECTWRFHRKKQILHIYKLKQE